MLFSRRSDLPPPSADQTGGLVHWLVAAMVFLATLAVSGTMSLQIITANWHRDVSGTITVQVMPALGPPEESRVETEKRLKTALTLLMTTPGVASATPLEHERTIALLEPWLGAREIFEDLPIPRLIDVTLTPGREVNLQSLSERLAESVPGSSLDDHQAWLSKLVRFAYVLETLALTVVLLVGATTAVTVVYATRTGLAVHRSVIEILHLVGAQDDYIAKQFASRSMTMGLRGGLIGLGLALPVILGVGWFAGKMEGSLVPAVTLLPQHWALLAATPLGAALLARTTALWTVRRTLKRMV